jgi:hypothetical protein
LSWIGRTPHPNLLPGRPGRRGYGFLWPASLNAHALCLSANASNVIPIEAGEKIVKVEIALEA